ncbi:MAG: diphthine--ammonia ligase [Acidobacteriota bacterium]
MKEPVIVSWSGGKDSLMAMCEILRSENYCVASLITTVTRDYDRISMHGVRRELLHRQARALALPLHEVFISRNATNEEYESQMKEALAGYFRRGVRRVVFGDLFLEDIRQYRERLLKSVAMQPLFPIWHRDTSQTVREFLRSGFRAITTCVDAEKLDSSLVGRLIDKDFLASLPRHVDPCGENGEFHSFVFDGPLFDEEIKFTVGETVLRDHHFFCDLIPA